MTRSSCLKLRRIGVLTAITAGLIAAPATAQMPPRPTFTLSQHPDLFYNVWPADLNRDSAADLIAGTRTLSQLDPGDVVIALGRGDGTFRPPVAVAYRAVPLIPADFNKDGLVDLVILREGVLEVLPGNGDGSFGAARPIDENRQGRGDLRAWAFSADMTGDGHRDLIVPDFDGEFSLRLYPGTSTLAFGPAVMLSTSNDFSPLEIAGGDFNGDGRRDFALVNVCCEVSVYLNQGGNTFGRSDFHGVFNDIVAADVNGDGRLDLVGVSGRYDQFRTDTDPGLAVVHLGNGDGTFRAPVSYSTGVRGTTSVVVGDFNGDGRADVATGNRSVVAHDDLGFHLWDSVSIFPGDGTGRLLSPAIYSLAYIRQGDLGIGFDRSSPYWGNHHQLNTADLNNDRRTDLITSPGVTLLNRAPISNRAPVVFAGPSRTDYNNESQIRLVAEASDPDMDWLTFRWTNENGQVLSTLPFAGVFQEQGTIRTYTVTVNDARGGVATQSVTIHNARYDVDPIVFFTGVDFSQNVRAGVPLTVGWDPFRPEQFTGFELSFSVDDGRTFSVVPGCGNLPVTARSCTWESPGPLSANARIRLIGLGNSRATLVSPRFGIVAHFLPPGWSSTDVGAVGAPGVASVATGVWTIEGSGAGIGGTADEFQYVHQTVGSQFTLTARLASLEDLNALVEAGIMVREDLSPGARHVSLFATPGSGGGLAFLQRSEPNGASVAMAGPSVAPPIWFRVGRFGDTVSAYYRLSPSQPWTLVGRRTIPNLRNVLYVGFAVSSHADGALATAIFDDVVLERGNPINRTEDVGEVGVPGSTTFDGVLYELQGSGEDVWNNQDSFHFAFSYGFFSGGTAAGISARVRSVENTHIWAKAGVMVRELSGVGPTPLPDARHVMVAITPGRGAVMQYRPTAGGPSVHVGGRAMTAPAFVRVTTSGGGVYTGWVSTNGTTWQQLGTVTLPNMFAAPGLFVTSVNNATLATAAFDDVRFIPF